jgi:hypothetical protein
LTAGHTVHRIDVATSAECRSLTGMSATASVATWSEWLDKMCRFGAVAH